MANPNESQDQGFNTIRNSSIPLREKKTNLRTYTFFGIILMAVLLVVTLLITVIGGIIANVAGNQTDPNGRPLDKNIVWENKTLSDADTLYGPLVLVNATHQYTFPQVGPKDDPNLEEIYAAWATHSPRIYQLSGLSAYMNKTALYAMDKMLADFNANSGKDNVLISYAYRTAQDQTDLGSATAAGFSDHHTGYGVVLKYVVDGRNYDLISETADPAYAWIRDNCHKYGFVIRYPEDKADKTGVSDYTEYYRYVGIPHATYMTEQSLCLEEYVEVVKGYSSSNPLKITGADGHDYEVYYAAVSGDTIVKVPQNFDSTISGTNDGGVIVTVNRSVAAVVETEAESGAESIADTTPAA